MDEQNLNARTVLTEQDQSPFTSPTLDPLARSVLNQNVNHIVSHAVVGADAATAANYGNIFVSERGYFVMAVSEVHRVAGTDGGSVTLTVEKCGTGVAPDSGISVLLNTFNLKGTANTPQFGTLTSVGTVRMLQKGDRLVLRDVGTLTSVADVCTTVILKEI